MSKTPLPFCFNKNKFKVFVLGADPVNNTYYGKRKYLPTVFNLGTGDPRYFNNIYINLKAIGLELDDIYVQNLITEYLDNETSKNKNWELIAVRYFNKRKDKFDKVDKAHIKPVLVTSERVFNFLLNDSIPRRKANEYYELKIKLPVKPSDNKLKRPMFPFYRNPKYSLNKPEWRDYLNLLKNYFSKLKIK